MHPFGGQERYFRVVCACSYEAAHFVLGAPLSKYTFMMSWALMFLITLISALHFILADASGVGDAHILKLLANRECRAKLVDSHQKM